MNPTLDHETTFLSSVFDPPRDNFFQGYCFYDSDFIFGATGAEKFLEATGNQIRGGLDGCYVTAHRSGRTYRFDTDYAGYKVLYWYHDGDLWCVSNSIAQIVDFLTEQGVGIEPNYAHLANIMGKGSGSHQLFSFETVVRGVKLVPRATTLVITSHEALLEPWSPIETQDYEEGLSHHLHTWISRYETLMLAQETDFTIDLTGGVDSRTNLGLTLKARQRMGDAGRPPRLNCGSTPSNTADLEVATALTAHYDIDLNDARKFRGYPLAPSESFQTYRDLSVGAYYPFYIPAEGPSPAKIHIGGGGGEIHRKFYENHLRSKDPELFYKNYAGRLKPSVFRSEFIRDARQAIEIATPEGADPLRAHYREFRHRYHCGRSPRFAVAFTPLDSVSADIAQSQAGPERLDRGQFNYDVLHSLDPELLEMQFDSPAKAPSAAVKESLIRASVPVDANPGNVWMPSEVPQRTVNRTKVARFEEYKAAVHEASDNPFVRDFWGEPTVELAKTLIEDLVDGRSIGNAVNGKPISAVLAAHLVTPR